jgi:hypothetical protein
MFPRLRDRLGEALDTVVDFSTLGEYRLPRISEPCNRVAPTFGWEVSAAHAAGDAGAGTARRTVAGGAAALHGNASRRALLGAPAATPAARRQRRPGAPPPPEQVCLAHQPARS